MADKEQLIGFTRFRFRDLEPFVSDLDPNKAFAQYWSAAPVTPLGHLRQSITNTPAPLAPIPSGTKRAHLYNLSDTETIWFTDFAGQEPDASLGFPIRPDSWMLYDIEINSDALFATLGASASLAIAFYG